MLIGGAGLVGSHIVDQLLSEPVTEIVVSDNMLRGTEASLSRASVIMKVLDRIFAEPPVVERVVRWRKEQLAAR